MYEAEIPNWFMLRNPRTGETASYDCEEKPQIQLRVGGSTCTVPLLLRATQKYGVRLRAVMDVDWPSAAETAPSRIYLKNPRTDEQLTWEVKDAPAWLVPLDLVLPMRVVETLVEVQLLEGRCLLHIDTAAPWERILTDVSDEEIQEIFGMWSDTSPAERREHLRQMYAAYRGLPYQPLPVLEDVLVPAPPPISTESLSSFELPPVSTEPSSVTLEPAAPPELPPVTLEPAPSPELPPVTLEPAPSPELPPVTLEPAPSSSPPVSVVEAKKTTTPKVRR